MMRISTYAALLALVAAHPSRAEHGVFASKVVRSVSEQATPDREVRGPVSVTDGDTVKMYSQSYRLDGVDAPEKAQLCQIGSQSYSCGLAARRALAELIARQPLPCITDAKKPAERKACGDRVAKILAGRPVAIRVGKTDLYGRFIGTVLLDGQNLNRQMVAAGHALAYRKRNDKGDWIVDSPYLAEELVARTARRGVWAGDFEAPGAYRRGLREKRTKKE